MALPTLERLAVAAGALAVRVELAALLPLHLIAAGARLPVSSLARKSDGPLVVAASLAIDGRRLLLRGRLGQDARGHLAVAAPHARVVQVPRAAVDAARLLPAVDAAAPIALCRAADAGQERLRARFVHAADDASGAPSHEVATREVVSETPVETAGDYPGTPAKKGNGLAEPDGVSFRPSDLCAGFFVAGRKRDGIVCFPLCVFLKTKALTPTASYGCTLVQPLPRRGRAGALPRRHRRPAMRRPKLLDRPEAHKLPLELGLCVIIAGRGGPLLPLPRRSLTRLHLRLHLHRRLRLHSSLRLLLR